MITLPDLKALSTDQIAEVIELAYFKGKLTKELYLAGMLELKARNYHPEPYAGLGMLGLPEWRKEISDK